MLLLLILTSCSRSSSGSLPDALLWKIEGPEIQTSYLFGTIHIMPRAEFNIDPKVSEALSNCEQLVLELDIDDINIQTEVLKYATMQDDTRLSSILSEEDYAKVEAIIQETLGIGLASFDRFKPFVISTFLIGRYIDGAPASFELTLARLAEEKGIEVEGLETVEQQMAVFDRIPYEDQARELVEMVEDEEELKAEYQQLLAQYKAEDLQGMFDLMVNRMDGQLQIDELLYNRNAAWIPQIGEAAKDFPTFFGVGAAHLAGEKGVIALLRKEGYTLTPQ